jgi:hypothetical protein
MRYYLLRKGTEFIIYKVTHDLVLEFLEKHKDQVLLEADNLMQLLLQFEREWVYDVEYSKIQRQ